VGSYVNSNTIRDCAIVNNVDGILLTDTLNPVGLTNLFANAINIENNTFENNTGIAIALNNFNNVTIHKNWIEAATLPINGIKATDCQNLSISSLWSQYTATYAVSLVRSTAFIGMSRGTKYTIADNSTLYFLAPVLGQAVAVTKDGTSVIRQLAGISPTYTISRSGTVMTPMIQNHATTQEVSALNVRWGYDGVPAGYTAGASAGGIGVYTPLTTGSVMGSYMFAAAAATKLIVGAQISAVVKETWTDTSAACALQFWTTVAGSTNPTRRMELQPEGHLYPVADNAYTLGGASNRWSVVYAGNGTINTSDEREKQDIAVLDDAEKRVAVALKGLIKKFRFKDAVLVKGDAARIHVGVIAQDVVTAFGAEGLDARRYGMLCYDEWPEQQEVKTEWAAEFDADGALIKAAGSDVSQEYRAAGNRYGVRYDQLLAFVIGSL